MQNFTTLHTILQTLQTHTKLSMFTQLYNTLQQINTTLQRCTNKNLTHLYKAKNYNTQQQYTQLLQYFTKLYTNIYILHNFTTLYNTKL